MPATVKGNYSYMLAVYCGPALVSCLVLLALSGVGGSADADNPSSNSRAYYCGIILSNTMAKLCHNFTEMHKKSDLSLVPLGEDNYVDGAGTLEDVQQNVKELRLLADRSEDTIYRVLMSLRALGSPSHAFHRVRRGLVDECCRRSCTKATLRSYCSY